MRTAVALILAAITVALLIILFPIIWRVWALLAVLLLLIIGIIALALYLLGITAVIAKFVLGLVYLLKKRSEEERSKPMTLNDAEEV